jgi:hypothetical protein
MASPSFASESPTAYLPMKRLILPFALTLILTAGCKPQTSSSATPSVPGATALSLSQPWRDVTIKLLIPGSSGPPFVKSIIVEVPAKIATYNRSFFVLALDDPFTGETFVVNGYENLHLNDFIPGRNSPVRDALGRKWPRVDYFYFSSNSGPVLCYVGPGELSFGKTYDALPTAPGSVATAIARFESEYDADKLQAPLSEFNRISLMPVATQYFFSDVSAPGGGQPFPKIESLDLTDGILRLGIQNPETKGRATFWIDLKARKVIESVVDGQQMDLTTGKPYAVPLKSS